MPALVAGIHVLTWLRQESRGWPGQARPWQTTALPDRHAAIDWQNL